MAVWKYLAIYTRENKITEMFQWMKFWKRFKSKHKCLLNNLSGVITGGLWAIIGMLLNSFHK